MCSHDTDEPFNLSVGRRQAGPHAQIPKCVDGIGAVADYPLGRIGSCLRPGMVRGPGPFIVNFLYLINNLVSDFVTARASAL